MFTTELQFINTTGTWANAEVAESEIADLMRSTYTATDATKLAQLEADAQQSWTTSLSDDGTIITFTKTVTQHALDVFDTLSETCGVMDDSSHIQRNQDLDFHHDVWTPVGE